MPQVATTNLLIFHQSRKPLKSHKALKGLFGILCHGTLQIYLLQRQVEGFCNGGEHNLAVNNIESLGECLVGLAGIAPPLVCQPQGVGEGGIGQSKRGCERNG